MLTLNLCTTCGEDFASVAMFDLHRVGKHSHLFDADHPDGRRCLTEFEMRRKGWTKNERGRWHDPSSTAKVRDTFQKASLASN